MKQVYRISWLDGCGGIAGPSYGLPSVITADDEAEASEQVKKWGFIFEFFLTPLGTLHELARPIE